MLRLPPLHALRVFEAVAHLSNFTNVAHELHLTQSAVSRQIRNLEEFFGVPLIIRDERILVRMPRLGDFYHRHPGVEVVLTTVWEDAPSYRLDQYDFAIQFGSTELTDASVEQLHEETLTAICAPILPWSTITISFATGCFR